MTGTTEKTVGQIAAEKPAAVRVFEKYGIDFCCGGKVPVAKACESHGVAVESLMREVEEAGNSAPDLREWVSAPLNVLIDHIIGTHHAYLKAELPKLSARMAKVINAHGERRAELAQMGGILEDLREELEAHLMKEEMVLFPIIRRMEAGERGAAASHCGSVANPIRVMEHEHDAAGTALARLRELSSGYQVPADACNTYRALYYELEQLEGDLHRHIHLENNILFPRAATLEGR